MYPALLLPAHVENVGHFGVGGSAWPTSDEGRSRFPQTCLGPDIPRNVTKYHLVPLTEPRITIDASSLQQSKEPPELAARVLGTNLRYTQMLSGQSILDIGFNEPWTFRGHE